MNRVVTLASVVVGTALVMLLGSRFGVLLHPIVVPVTVLVLVVALWLVRGAGTPVMNAWTRDNPAPERLTVDHRLRTYRWAARDLSEAGWDYRIRPTLLAAVEDHLREQGWDPIHAAEAIDLLPLELRPLLTDPHYRPTTQAQLDTVITRIEELWTSAPGPRSV